MTEPITINPTPTIDKIVEGYGFVFAGKFERYDNLFSIESRIKSPAEAASTIKAVVDRDVALFDVLVKRLVGLDYHGPCSALISEICYDLQLVQSAFSDPHINILRPIHYGCVSIRRALFQINNSASQTQPYPSPVSSFTPSVPVDVASLPSPPQNSHVPTVEDPTSLFLQRIGGSFLF